MKKHLVRNALVCLALTGGVVAGTAGIASAEGTGTTERPTQEQVCNRAQDVWQRLQKLDQRLHDRYQKVVALRDKAAAEGRTELAEKLTQRLERLKTHHERVEAHLKALHDKAADACDLPDAPSTPLAA